MNNALERMALEQDKRFNELDKAEMVNLTKNYSDEEQRSICKVISTQILLDEISRREQATIKVIEDALSVIEENKNPLELELPKKESFIADLRGALRCNGRD